MNNHINNLDESIYLNSSIKSRNLTIKTTLAATAIAIATILSTTPARAENIDDTQASQVVKNLKDSLRVDEKNAELLKRESTKNDIYKFAGSYDKRVFGRTYMERIRDMYADIHSAILDEFQGRNSDEDKEEKYVKLGYLLEGFKIIIDSSQIGKFEISQIEQVVEVFKNNGFKPKNKDDLDGLVGALRIQDKLWQLSEAAGSLGDNEKSYFNYDKYKLK